MAELLQCIITKMPKVMVVGKELIPDMTRLNKGENPIPEFWNQCFKDNIFANLEAQDSALLNSDYVGVMYTDKATGQAFRYLVGMLMSEDAVIPEGYQTFLIDACEVGIGYIRGEEGDVLMNAHRLTSEAIQRLNRSATQLPWIMELYNCPRWTNPDENGKVILDYYLPLD